MSPDLASSSHVIFPMSALDDLYSAKPPSALPAALLTLWNRLFLCSQEVTNTDAPHTFKSSFPGENGGRLFISFVGPNPWHTAIHMEKSRLVLLQIQWELRLWFAFSSSQAGLRHNLGASQQPARRALGVDMPSHTAKLQLSPTASSSCCKMLTGERCCSGGDCSGTACGFPAQPEVCKCPLQVSVQSLMLRHPRCECFV